MSYSSWMPSATLHENAAATTTAASAAPRPYSTLAAGYSASAAGGGGGAMMNGSRSMNASDEAMPFAGSATAATAVIYITVFMVGLLGNTLVIYVVVRYAKMKTVTNMYILNLALADELYILGIPFLGTQSVLSYWPYGQFLCKVYMTADSMSQFTSTFCLTVMTIDRYLAVVHPMRSSRWRRPQVAMLINGMVWVVSFLVVLPVTVFSEVQETFNSCNISWPSPQDTWSTAFILYTAILGFFGPLLIICLCYLLIVVKVRTASARVGLTKRRKSERKVTRMVVIIVLVFILCWLPFFVAQIVNLVYIIPETNVMAALYFILVILTYVNSCANPVLYGFLSENFKQSFRKVLCVHRSANGVGTTTEQIVTSRSSALHGGDQNKANDPRRGQLFSPRSHAQNGHVQSGQSIQTGPCGNIKVELLPAETVLIDNSAL